VLVAEAATGIIIVGVEIVVARGPGLTLSVVTRTVEVGEVMTRVESVVNLDIGLESAPINQRRNVSDANKLGTV